MQQLLEFFKTSWYVMRELASELTQGGEDYEHDYPMASAAQDDHHDDSPLFKSVLPPAQHNGWGSVPDYTYGMPDD